MALKSWQTNKKNNAPQKKGHGKEKPTAKAAANEKQAPGAARDAEPRLGVDAAPAVVTYTPAVTEHAEPHTSEEPAGEIYEATETAVAAVEMQVLPAEEVEIEPVAPGTDDTVPANEPEAEATPTELVTTAQTEPIESSPAQPEAAATASRTAAETMAVAPEGTQAAGTAQVPEETQPAAPALSAPALSEPAPAEPAPAEPVPAESALIGEAAVATEKPVAAMEPAPSGSIDAGPAPTSGSKESHPLGRDPRLPPAGTVLQRRDRHGNVRCECTVEQDGIRYAGKLYKSLSAAAIAATKDMGLKSKTQNGHTFWGVAKPARPVRDTLESLERAWERYRERAEAAAVQSGADDGERARVRQAIEKHTEMLSGLRARVA
jgi:hypothetical protein